MTSESFPHFLAIPPIWGVWFCTRNDDPLKYGLIEFSKRTSVVPAMLMSGRQLGNSVITGMISLFYLDKNSEKVPLKAIKPVI